jgi:structural maintenance of chromosome 3 (chondroitin sulfate proteoglycan 6)
VARSILDTQFAPCCIPLALFNFANSCRYIDPRKSRLEAVRAVERWREEYEGHRARAREIRSEIEAKDQEITAAKGDLQKIEQKLRQLDDSFDPLKVELRSKSGQIDRLRDQLDAKIRQRDGVERMLKQYDDQNNAYGAELASEFKKALTADEERELDAANSTVQDLKIQWNELSKKRRELEGRKTVLEVDLHENLRLKLDQLNSQEVDNAASGNSQGLKEAQRELKRVTKAAESVAAKLDENEQDIEQAENKIASLHQEKDVRLQKNAEIRKHIESFQKRMEKSIAKKAILTAEAVDVRYAALCLINR